MGITPYYVKIRKTVTPRIHYTVQTSNCPQEHAITELFRMSNHTLTLKNAYTESWHSVGHNRWYKLI